MDVMISEIVTSGKEDESILTNSEKFFHVFGKVGSVGPSMRSQFAVVSWICNED